MLAPLAGIGNWFVRLQAKRFGAGLVTSEMVSSFGLAYGNRRTVEEFLRIHPDGVRAGDGDVPGAHLRIQADSGRLLDLTTAPLRFGLPDPMAPEGRAILRDLLARRVRIRGLLRHPLRLARLTQLLSVADAGATA